MLDELVPAISGGGAAGLVFGLVHLAARMYLRLHADAVEAERRRADDVTAAERRRADEAVARADVLDRRIMVKDEQMAVVLGKAKEPA